MPGMGGTKGTEGLGDALRLAVAQAGAAASAPDSVSEEIPPPESQANASAEATDVDTGDNKKLGADYQSGQEDGSRRHHDHKASRGYDIPIEQRPPPIFSNEYGQVEITQDGLDTKAKVASDGRLNISINQKSRRLSELLVPALRSQLNLHLDETPSAIPGLSTALTGEVGYEPPPPLNVVVHVVGSRGDVQPFIALGKVLKERYNHRVRIATHSTFKGFVEENGLEHFSIGGDPAELMAFMVKNPGLMPGMDSLKSGDVGKRRKGMYEIVQGCWRSCIEAGDGTGIAASDDSLDSRSSLDSGIGLEDPHMRPFVADAIIANPPSFAHIHCAEKLGIPLHLMFTMPWSPTQAFPHPLANVQSTNADSSVTNFVSYALVEMMTWQGLGDIINRFRERSLGLEPVSLMWAPGMAARLRIPYTYCWSPSLIPKPRDWSNHISISGFYFLSLANSFSPEPDLQHFLDSGPTPIYIGFGSIVVDDADAMTRLIFEAVKKTGQRALVSKGWGGFGGDAATTPDGIFMLGNVPHDWLFKRVSCVVHHGGAGTTAAGIALGKPTVIVPFFGDQPFWGAMVAKAGAGPKPIPSKVLTADNLAKGILEALNPNSLERAKELGRLIGSEDGTASGARSFHKELDLSSLRCSLAPERAAVWRIKRTKVRLSAFAATTLGNEGLLDFHDLKLYRPREYDAEDGPWDPISGGASALLGTVGSMMMGAADFPVEILKALRFKSSESSEHTSPATTPLETPKSEISSIMTKGNIDNEDASTGTTSPLLAQRSSTSHRSMSGDGILTPTASIERQNSTKAMAQAIRGSFSRPSSRPGSRGSSPNRRATSPGPHQHQRRNSGHITLEAAIGAGKGIGRIIGAGVKSPMDFTLGIARGFHNAPKLYGDESVRPADKVTGIQSGLKAAGKEFGFGFFDGVTGLVTQPLEGAKKEGVAGFVKGVGKGIGGVILKPGAAIWGLPGYTFKGIYKELQKHFGASVQNYIVAARTAQGYEEWSKSTLQQRLDVVSQWQIVSGQVAKQKQQHHIHHPKDCPFSSHCKLTKRKIGKGEFRTDHSIRHTDVPAGLEHSADTLSKSVAHHDDAEFEKAIHASVAATSKGNPEEDQMIERAIRASVLELKAASSQEDGEGAIQRAIKASIAEARRPSAKVTGREKAVTKVNTHEEDIHLEQALRQSLLEHQVSHPRSIPYHGRHDDSGIDTDDDENIHNALKNSQHDAVTGDSELKRAIAISEQADAEQTKPAANSLDEEQIVLEYVKRQSLLEEEHKRKLMVASGAREA